MNDQPRPTAVYFDEPVKEFDGDQIYWRYRTGGYLTEDGGSYGRCATYTDANIIILKRKFAELKRESDARAETIAALANNLAASDNKNASLRGEARASAEMIAELEVKLKEAQNFAIERMHTLDASRAENAKLREALAPSAETKAAYIGEFSFEIEDCDEDGEPCTRKVEVPWTTVKEIMAAISRQALAGKDGE